MKKSAEFILKRKKKPKLCCMVNNAINVGAHPLCYKCFNKYMNLLRNELSDDQYYNDISYGE